MRRSGVIIGVIIIIIFKGKVMCSHKSTHANQSCGVLLPQGIGDTVHGHIQLTAYMHTVCTE